MAKRPVSTAELQQVARQFNGTPVEGNARSFAFGTTADSDAFNAAMDKLEAGATLDSVIKPQRKSGDALDAAVGFVGGLMHQMLDPAVDASRALLPSGAGVEAGIERLGGGKKGLTENDIYRAATYVPETTSGTIGSLLPLVGGAVTGVDLEGAIPTAITIGGGLAAQKAAEKVTDVVTNQTSLTPEQRDAWRNLVGLGAGLAGGAKAHQMAPRVTIPEAAAAVANVGQTLKDTARQRLAGAAIVGSRGYKKAGYPGLVGGTVGGFVEPGLVNLTEDTLVNIAKGEPAATETVKPTQTPKAPKATATLAEQRQQRIDNGVKLADQVRSVDTLTLDEANKVLPELDKSIGAFEANKSPVPQSVRDAQQKAATIVRTAEIAKAREQGQAVLTSTKTQRDIADLKSLLGPEALNGNIWLLESSPSAARSYYNDVAKIIAKYDAAGEQPPAEFVQAFDYLHDMVLKDKSIDAGAYDAAIESLTTAASQGPKAFAAAVQAIPAKTMNIVRTVGNDIFTGLQSASRNAGGALVEGQPYESWMVKTMRDVLDMDRAPAETSELGGMNVPTQAEAVGGAATVPSNLEMLRKPGAAVSVEVSPSNRGGQLTPAKPVSPTQAATEAITDVMRPEDVRLGPSSPAGEATVPSGVGGRRVGRNWVSETELPPDVADAAAQAVEAQSDVSKAKGRRSPSERATSRGEALKTDTSQLSAQRVQQIADQQVFFRNALRFRQLLDAFYATPKPQRTMWLLQRSEAGAPSNASLLSDLHNDIFKSKSKIVTPQDVVTHTQFEGAMNNPQFRPYLKKLFKSLKKD